MPLQTATQFGEGVDDIDLGDIFASVRRQWPKIAIITAITTLAALWFVAVSEPEFTMSGSLYFGDAAISLPQSQQGINVLSDFESINDVPTEVQLIESKSLVEQAILETGLNASVEPEDAEPMSYWRWRFEDDKNVAAYAPRPGDLVALYATIDDPGSDGATFQMTFGPNGTYTLESLTGLFEGPPTTTLHGTLGQPAAGDGVTMLIKPAVDGPPPAAGSVYIVDVQPAKALADGVIGGLLKVAAGGTTTAPTQTAQLLFSWFDPYQGQQFLNQLMRDFIAQQLGWKTESASNTQDFVAEQLQKIQASLSDADAKLAAYKAKTGILDVPSDATAVVNQLANYQAQRAQFQLQQQALQQLVAGMTDPKAGLNPYLVTQAGDTTLASLATSLANAQIQLQSQSLQFTAAAPEVQAQEATIARTESAIRQLLSNDETLAANNLANVDQLIATYQDQLKDKPAQALQIIELSRASDVFGQLYVLLMQNEEAAEVSKAATIVNTRIVSLAEVPLYATKPKTTITVVVGLVLGLLAGLTLVLTQRVLSGRFHSEGDVRRAVTLPVLGLIPRRTKRELGSGVFPAGGPNAFSESFRLLRSRLYQLDPHEAGRCAVVLVASGATDDGKTTVAANLAKAIADDGRRVALIDADLHRGHLFEALGVTRGPGLAEWMATKQRAPLQAVPGQNFLALPAGTFPANPSELLNDPSLAMIFKILRSEFDYLVVDCPPLPSVADTLTLAKYADVILSVVFLERTKRAVFTSHIDTFGPVSVRQGVVINGLISGAHYYRFAYGERAPARRGILRFLRRG